MNHFPLVVLNGLSTLYGPKKKLNPKYQCFMKSIEEMSLESAFTFLQEHLELLYTPIIFDNKKLLLGYDNEDIRKFITKEKRRVDARLKMTHLKQFTLLAG